MSIFMRLSKFLRPQSTLSKILLNKLNIENDQRQFLNYYQTIHFINQCTSYSSISYLQVNINQDSDIDQKMVILNKEAVDYGKLIKLNIDDILQDMKNSETTLNLKGLFLLRCCSELIINKPAQFRQQLAQEIWNKLNDLGVQLEVSHYNALLDVYIKTNYQFSPFDILWQMINAQVEPNQATFKKLIFYFCNTGNIKEATQILNYMKDIQLPVTEDILSSFSFAHCINDNMNGAMEIVKNMELLNITVTSQTHSAFMYAFARKGDLESIEKTLAECKNHEIEITEKIFFNIIFELCVNGFSEKVDKILTLLPKSAISLREGHILIYKLVENGQIDAAFKIIQYLITNMTNANEISSNFLIELLIIFNVPVEKSIGYCQMMKEKSINHLAFISAINKSIENHMYESSFSFMKAWKESGGLIKQNYFYPIFKDLSKSCKYKDLNTAIQKMILELEVYPSIYTLKTYILPYMQGEAEEKLSILINHRVKVETAVNAITLQLLSDNKIREVVKFMSRYHTFNYDLATFKYDLFKAFRNTEDISSAAWIMHFFYKNVINNKINIELYQQILDSCTLEICNHLQTKSKYMLLMFFRNLIDKGLSISPEVIEIIKKKLGDEMTLEISKALSNLKLNKLVPKRIFTEHVDYWPKILMDIEKLESAAKQISENSSKGKVHINNDLLTFYCSVKNEEKVFNLIEIFDKNDIVMSTQTMNSLTKMFVDLRKIPESEFWLNKMRKKVPNFRISQTLCLKLVNLLINNGDIKKALEYLVWPNYCREYSTHHCSRILNALLKYDDENLLHQFFELLRSHGYIKELKNELLAPFIKLHLNRNDTEAALEKFEWTYKNYKLTPLKIELIRKCIFDGNKHQLQKIQNICTNVNKEIVFFNIAMIYLENNQKEEAMNVMKNHCSHVQQSWVTFHADKLYRNNQDQDLEKLLEIFNDLQYDVNIICVLLLKSYGVKNQWEKCYDLWMKMQDKNINPSPTFMDCINYILTNKNIVENQSFIEFNAAIQKREYEEAVELLQRVPLIYKRDCYSILCEKYVWKNQFSKTVELWRHLNINYNMDINLMTAELILSKMLEHKDLENLEKIEEFITPKFKKQSGFNYYLNEAYLESGYWNLYLKNLECKLNEGMMTSNNLSLHIELAIKSLIKYPEIQENFESLAYKFAEKKIIKPITALWVYYFLKKNPVAKEIWIKYLKNSTKYFLWSEVFNFSQHITDPDLYIQLANLINESLIKRNNKLLLHNRLIKKCLKLNDPKKYEYGLQCLQQGMVHFNMNEFDIHLLVKLEEGLKASGIAWPWSVNEKIR